MNKFIIIDTIYLIKHSSNKVKSSVDNTSIENFLYCYVLKNTFSWVILIKKSIYE